MSNIVLKERICGGLEVNNFLLFNLKFYSFPIFFRYKQPSWVHFPKFKLLDPLLSFRVSGIIPGWIPGLATKWTGVEFLVHFKWKIFVLRKNFALAVLQVESISTHFALVPLNSIPGLPGFQKDLWMKSFLTQMLETTPLIASLISMHN